MAETRSKWQKLREDAQALLDENAQNLRGWRSRAHKFLHFCLMVVRSFSRNRLPVRASALAYATLLALVPMLAVVVSITSTFLKQEGEERIDQFIQQMVASMTPPDLRRTNIVTAATNLLVNVTNAIPQAASLEQTSEYAELPGAGSNSSQVMELSSTRNTAATQSDPQSIAPVGTSDGTNVTTISQKITSTNEVMVPSFMPQEEAIEARRRIVKNINEYIQNTRSGALGVTGSVLLIFVGISMLSRIEDVFNDIWGAAKPRTWFMRIVLYWGVITLVPILLVVAMGLATGPQLEGPRKLLTYSPVLAGLVFRVLPIVLLSTTFSLFYTLMPNTRVSWRGALVGGTFAGVLFHLNNLVSVLYVSRVVSYSKIYGSLGLVPVFMVGLYLSWMILLLGAQVAYAFQNRATYFEEKLVENVNQRGREFVALRLMTSIGRNFAFGTPPPTPTDMCKEMGIPSRLARQILDTLATARLVVETCGAEPGYVPSRSLHQITCHDVLLAMRAANGQEVTTREEPMRAEVLGEYQRIQEAERAAASSVTLLALVQRQSAKLISGGV